MCKRGYSAYTIGMSYAADFDRAVKPLDERLEEIATPLREGIADLTRVTEELNKSLWELAEKQNNDNAARTEAHNQLAARVTEESENLLSVARSLGFSPKVNPAVTPVNAAQQ